MGMNSRTHWMGIVIAMALVVLFGARDVALADESEPIMGTQGSTQMTIEVLDQPDYDLMPQSEPKGGEAKDASSAPAAADEPTYPDMPQTGAGAPLALVTCVSALGVFLVGLEGWR